MRKRAYHKRMFLNDGKGMAAVEVTVTNCSYNAVNDKGKKTGKRRVNIEGEVQITDCRRSVTLDFGIYGKRNELHRQLKKADRLIEVFIKLRQALEKAYVEETRRRK